ncbi:MAG: hypothetical protein WD512_14760 [Candidatus Paceibacterota bacterium]
MELIILPQLVREKIENYVYLAKWKENTEKINQEYKEKVKIADSNNVIKLQWKYRGQRICDIEIKSNFSYRSYTSGYIAYRSIILSWKTNKYYYINAHEDLDYHKYECLKRPKNYYFSSGLNHPSGYKKSDNRFYYSRYAIDIYGD